MKKAMFWKWLLLVALTSASIAIVTPIKDKVKLGLDLRGGTMFVLEVKDADLSEDAKKDAPARALEVLRNRVDGMGIAEPVLYLEPNGRIVVQLPGLKADDREAAVRNIQSAAFLEFRIVHEDSYRLTSALFAEGKAPKGYAIEVVEVLDPVSGQTFTRQVYAKTESDVLFSPEEVRARKKLFGMFNAPPGYEFMLMPELLNGKEYFSPYYVFRRPELTGEQLADARTDFGQFGEPTVGLKFNEKGAKRFGEVTGDYAPGGAKNPRQDMRRQLAIVLDGKLYSAPQLNEAIYGGSASISGSFSIEEANDLSMILRAGSLPAPVKVVEERGVDPTLGEDSITSGMRAAIIGCAAVLVFMLIYYMLPGVIANVALVLDMLLLPLGMVVVSGFLGVFSGSTGAAGLPVLTLPGIAGIVLTIGMAVDANVLIFERIREELDLGKSLKGAIAAGYQKAFSTIFDANITTLLTAVILFANGSGPIRGFAVTLSAGIVVSMFVALFASRLFFDTFIHHSKITHLRMMQVFKAPNFDFIGKRRIAAIVSLSIILISWAVFAIKGQQNFSVDFTGGSTISFTYTEKQPVEVIRETLEDAGIKNPSIQYQEDKINNANLLAITVKNAAAGDIAHDSITEKFVDYEEQSRGTVSSQVGKELKSKGILAIALAMLGIVAYVTVRFEFAFAMGAIIAIIHDILITVGIFCLLGNQLSLPIVAALLTIVGYSVNDTIVVFDRIREDLKLNRGKLSYAQIANLSINQTLSRTVLTSVTTLLTVVMLVLFGGGAINDFAVTLLIGVIVGTYSSIFIATPIVLFWHRQNPVSDDDDEQVVGSIDNEQIEAALFEESPKQA